MNDFPIPLLGFAAWSGTGKTTLLTQLIPLLKDKGLRIGLVKHAHHHFDIDYPGKDSYRLRKAGAAEVVIASRKRIASIHETPVRKKEPVLADALAHLQVSQLDLVLVEGFKTETFPKIELHRKALKQPFLYRNEKPKENKIHGIIALAIDDPLDFKLPTDEHPSLVLLDLNQPEQIAAFILNWHSTVKAQTNKSRLN